MENTDGLGNFPSLTGFNGYYGSVKGNGGSLLYETFLLIYLIMFPTPQALMLLSSQSNGVIADATIGTYLVREAAVSTVLIPATVWLFGSALAGLIGFGRRKQARLSA